MLDVNARTARRQLPRAASQSMLASASRLAKTAATKLPRLGLNENWPMVYSILPKV
jgi:hypothetical protein